MTRRNIFASSCFIGFIAAPVMAYAQASGIVAAPAAAAYSDLTKLSYRIIDDLRTTEPLANTIVLYNATTFGAVPYYSSATDLVRTAVANICTAESAAVAPRLTPTIDLGSAATGLAALIQITVPTYTVQSQTLSLDNSALVGSFATAAKGSGYSIINPDYLLPSISQRELTCGDYRSSNSLADLWKFANKEASIDQAKAATKKPLKDALDSFQKLKDALTVSSDKDPPPLGRALAVESLARIVEQGGKVAVVDMRLDAANVDSTTKNILWWRKTRFSANVAAHYWLFSVRGTGPQFGLVLLKPGSVNILTKDVDLQRYGSNGVQ